MPQCLLELSWENCKLLKFRGLLMEKISVDRSFKKLSIFEKNDHKQNH